MDKIACPFDDVDGPIEFTQDGWDVRQCPTCKLLYVSPRPEPSVVEDIYRGDSAHGAAVMHVDRSSSSLDWLRATMTLRRMRKHKPVGRLLEIGPGGGAFLAAAMEAGYEAAAVELNPIQAQHIRSELGIPCWESMDDVKGMFDIVYHCDVLSHFSDPQAAFSRIASILAADGVHIFETGDGDVDPKRRYLLRNWQLPDHLFFFTEASITRLCERTGFRRVETTRYSIAPLLRAWHIVNVARGRVVETERKSIPATTPQQTGTSAAAPRSGLKGLMFQILGLGFHGLRYGIGRVTPKKGRPQTAIFVTRKA